MKKILIALIVGFGLYHFLNQDKLFTVKYFYSGPRQTEVKYGLSSWSTSFFGFEQVDNIKDAYLNICHADPSVMGHNRWIAQYNYKNKTIYINEICSKNLNREDLIGVISHETGHFLGLDHNLERDSVMNNNTPYHTLPSKQDIERAKLHIQMTKYKKIIDELIF